MANTPDYYAVLGVAPSSDEVVIRAAFKALMLKYHPDTNKSPDAAACATAINAAHAVLGNKAARAAYDGQREADAKFAEQVKAQREKATREAAAKATKSEKAKPSDPPQRSTGSQVANVICDYCRRAFPPNQISVITDTVVAGTFQSGGLNQGQRVQYEQRAICLSCAAGRSNRTGKSRVGATLGWLAVIVDVIVIATHIPSTISATNIAESFSNTESENSSTEEKSVPTPQVVQPVTAPVPAPAPAQQISAPATDTSSNDPALESSPVETTRAPAGFDLATWMWRRPNSAR